MPTAGTLTSSLRRGSTSESGAAQVARAHLPYLAGTRNCCATRKSMRPFGTRSARSTRPSRLASPASSTTGGEISGDPRGIHLWRLVQLLGSARQAHGLTRVRSALHTWPCSLLFDIGNGAHVPGSAHHLGCTKRLGAPRCDAIGEHVQVGRLTPSRTPRPQPDPNPEP